MQAILALLVVLGLVVAAQAAVAVEDGVLVLTEENFDSVIGTLSLIHHLRESTIVSLLMEY